MNPSQALVLAFLIGVLAGLRSFTAPAAVAWAAHRRWLELRHSPLAFLHSPASWLIFTALALAELVADKLPSTPGRTQPLGLIARFLTGGLSGAAVAVSGASSLAFGAVLGAAGGIAGAFVGYQVRTRLVKALKVPDFVIAVLEDAVAIGGSLFIVCLCQLFVWRG
jgi:uncharacterized membrane protein